MISGSAGFFLRAAAYAGDSIARRARLTCGVVSVGSKPEKRWAYPEHVLALAVQDDGARLEVLAAEELGESQRDRVGRPRHDRLGLARGLLVLGWVRVLVTMAVVMAVIVLVLVLALLCLLLLLLLRLHPLGGLSLEVFCGCQHESAGGWLASSPMNCGTDMPIFSASMANCLCMAAICSGLGMGICPFGGGACIVQGGGRSRRLRVT